MNRPKMKHVPKLETLNLNPLKTEAKNNNRFTNISE